MAFSFAAWLATPSTIHGISVIGGIVAAAATQYTGHDLSAAVVLGGLVYGVAHVALPDNTGASSSTEQLVNDTVTAIAQKNLAAAMPKIMADTMAVVRSFQPVVVAQQPSNTTTITTSPGV